MGESFLYILGQYWKMCLGLLNFKYVLGMPDIPYIFGKRVDAGHKPTYLEKMKVSPVGSGTHTT